MWGYSYSLETESVLPCLFFVWDNAAPKVMPDPKPIEIPMAKLSRAILSYCNYYPYAYTISQTIIYASFSHIQIYPSSHKQETPQMRGLML